MSYGGQSSQDYRGTSGRVRILYRSHDNSMSLLVPDGFTQLNPPAVVTPGEALPTSTTLSGVTKRGVLGGSVAFSRPYLSADNYIGGPTRSDANVQFAGGAVTANDGRVRPLGFYLNDAAGNDFENRPAVASGKAPYFTPLGAIGVQTYETAKQIEWGGVAAEPFAWTSGKLVFASINGLITPRYRDALETYGAGKLDNTFAAATTVTGSPSVTILGVAVVVPTTAVPEVALDVAFRTFV